MSQTQLQSSQSTTASPLCQPSSDLYQQQLSDCDQIKVGEVVNQIDKLRIQGQKSNDTSNSPILNDGRVDPRFSESPTTQIADEPMTLQGLKGSQFDTGLRNQVQFESFVQKKKVDDSPKRAKKRGTGTRQREKESSSSDSDDSDASEKSDASLNSEEKAFQFMNSLDKEIEKKTQPETLNNTQFKKQEELEQIEENVLDMVSFHSRLSKNPLEVASLQKSVISSRLSIKDKQQIQKVIKKVNFFALRPENVVEKEDIDSQGMEEDMDYNLEDMNKSIQKKIGGLKRNPKSFNFNAQQFNAIVNEMEDIDKHAQTPRQIKD